MAPNYKHTFNIPLIEALVLVDELWLIFAISSTLEEIVIAFHGEVNEL